MVRVYLRVPGDRSALAFEAEPHLHLVRGMAELHLVDERDHQEKPEPPMFVGAPLGRPPW